MPHSSISQSECNRSGSVWLISDTKSAVRIGRRKWSAFRLCAYVGLLAGAALSLGLTVHFNMSLRTMILIVVVSVVTLVVVMQLARLLGLLQLVFYRHFFIVIGVVSILLWFISEPVLVYLDYTVLGIAAFVACGRVGCLMVGCCHGRPSSIGIRYREWQVTPAFPGQFLGVRLFPVQAVESLWWVFIVLGGCYQIWNEHTPGTAVRWLIAAYCPVRFVLEFARWRPAQSYYLGLSEAQWTSLILMTLLVIAKLSGVVP
jgi:prolipoprotein diacylglyceryl transferase